MRTAYSDKTGTWFLFREESSRKGDALRCCVGCLLQRSRAVHYFRRIINDQILHRGHSKLSKRNESPPRKLSGATIGIGRKHPLTTIWVIYDRYSVDVFITFSHMFFYFFGLGLCFEDKAILWWFDSNHFSSFQKLIRLALYFSVPTSRTAVMTCPGLAVSCSMIWKLDPALSRPVPMGQPQYLVDSQNGGGGRLRDFILVLV